VADEIAIESFLKEKRQFKPDPEFARRAELGPTAYRKLEKRAERDFEAHWAALAEEHIDWFRPWRSVLKWKPPLAQWFVGAKLNAAHNCVDRHLEGEHAWRRNKAAIIWEGEPGEQRVLTYGDLHREVSKFANVLLGLGVKKGDRVGIYMPMVPELPIAMLACARIGAPHTVIFGGFPPASISERLNDAQAVALITADGGWRRGEIVKLKENVDRALESVPSVQNVVVLARTQQPVLMKDGRDHWWHELCAGASAHCPPAKLDAEHPLFLLYTSGSTGKPKGILHTTGGYLVHAAVTAKYVFDLKEEDVYWCTADIGWVTGHSYVVYGLLANGATTLMYEGAPNHPTVERFWQLIDKYQVSIFYTAPTAIRSFMRWGDEHVEKYSLSSLRLLGSVGEPINPEAWMWYRKTVGRGHCPVVDTWWQTETGGVMISPLPGAVTTTPGSATRPFPGVFADVVDRNGDPAQSGYLVLTKPWPGMLRGIYGDPERYERQYWSGPPLIGEGASEKERAKIQAKWKRLYFAGDGARRDKNGNFWVMGRVDDVMNVSGHRISTAEVESALVSHPKVAESAVVGRPDPIKGTAVVGFVTLKAGVNASEPLREELRKHVANEIGAIGRPDALRFADALPKTRSGKIMRRLLRDLAAGRESVGDTTTLEDYSVLAKLRATEED
jgi:acetyl-CoA synthetase